MFRQKGLYPAKDNRCDFITSYGTTASQVSGYALYSYPASAMAGDLIFVAIGNPSDLVTHPGAPGFNQIHSVEVYAGYWMGLYWRHLSAGDPGANMGIWQGAGFFSYALYRPNFTVTGVSENVVYQYGGTGDPAPATVDLTASGKVRAALCQVTSNYGSTVNVSGAAPDFAQNVNWNPYEGFFAMKLYMDWETGGATTFDQTDTTGARSHRTSSLELTTI